MVDGKKYQSNIWREREEEVTEVLLDSVRTDDRKNRKEAERMRWVGWRGFVCVCGAGFWNDSRRVFAAVVKGSDVILYILVWRLAHEQRNQRRSAVLTASVGWRRVSPKTLKRTSAERRGFVGRDPTPVALARLSVVCRVVFSSSLENKMFCSRWRRRRAEKQEQDVFGLQTLCLHEASGIFSESGTSLRLKNLTLTSFSLRVYEHLFLFLF